jgi:hypothetical protein
MVAVDCLCPPRSGGGVRHPDGDTVTLRPVIGFLQVDAIKMALGVMYVEDPDAGIADILAVLRERYVLAGVESWTLVNDDGPIPVTRPTIRTHLLTNFAAASVVADAADDLYRDAVTAPLLNPALTSSQDGPTDSSTSAPTGSPDDSTSATPEEGTPRPSSPSSITTIRTVGTATTSSSPDGDSRSSPSLASAG